MFSKTALLLALIAAVACGMPINNDDDQKPIEVASAPAEDSEPLDPKAIELSPIDPDTAPAETTDASIASDDDHEDHPEIAVPASTESPPESFVRADADEDLQLTFEEFLHTDLSYLQVKKAEFEMLDSNSDGILSSEEFTQFYAKQEEEKNGNTKKYYRGIFKEFDENMDKQLNPTEVKRILSKRFLLKPRENFGQLFEKFDSDNSGALNLEEYQKFDQTFPFYELDPIQVPVV
jgi:Ca2+-binding EF-hand superfamily protein